MSGPVLRVDTDYPEIGPIGLAADMDAVAMLNDSGMVHIVLLNRNERRGLDVQVRLQGLVRTEQTQGRLYQSDAPFRPVTWKEPGAAFVRPVRISNLTANELRVRCPALSLVYLRLPVGR